MRLSKEKLRITLVKQGVKQKELSELSGISRATVNNICNGRSCSDVTGYKIAKALNVDVIELIETRR